MTPWPLPNILESALAAAPAQIGSSSVLSSLKSPQPFQPSLQVFVSCIHAATALRHWPPLWSPKRAGRSPANISYIHNYPQLVHWILIHPHMSWWKPCINPCISTGSRSITPLGSGARFWISGTKRNVKSNQSQHLGQDLSSKWKIMKIYEDQWSHHGAWSCARSFYLPFILQQPNLFLRAGLRSLRGTLSATALWICGSHRLYQLERRWCWEVLDSWSFLSHWHLQVVLQRCMQWILDQREGRKALGILCLWSIHQISTDHPHDVSWCNVSQWQPGTFQHRRAGRSCRSWFPAGGAWCDSPSLTKCT